MKLPELTEEMEESFASCEPREVAMLHCLRSIAVSLECILVVMGGAAEEIGAETFDQLVNIVEAHSVGTR